MGRRRGLISKTTSLTPRLSQTVSFTSSVNTVGKQINESSKILLNPRDEAYIELGDFLTI
jgi:hypothetical protein